MTRTPRLHVGKLVVALAVPQLVGLTAAFATISSVAEWYPTLAQPSFTPPPWVFGPVWTALYLMMGVALYLVWRLDPAPPGAKQALALYWIQLALNWAWSFLFFYFRAPGLALMEILALLVVLVWTTRAFDRYSRPAALLLAPYILWVGFATALNGGFWWLNR